MTNKEIIGGANMVKRCIATLGIGAVAISLSSVDSYAMEKGIITARALNVRSGPSTNNSIIGKVNKGQNIEILEKSNGWYKIKLSNGNTGWASGQYISIQSNSNSQTSEIINKKGKVTASTLNIRNGAGTNYSVISKATSGTIVDLLEKSNNGWYKVKLSSGIVGWASGSYISQINSSNEGSSDTTNPPTQPDDNTSEQKPTTPSNKEGVVNFAYSLIGTPYEWGGNGPKSFDCSGFTKYVYQEAKGKNIPRVSREQAQYGQEISMENISPGDLVYFDTDKNGVVNHVGIYVGSNQFIHCSGTPSNPDKVKISNLATDYWSGVVKGARRF